MKFLGFQKIDQLPPKTGLVVLSSTGEALPLVLLAGFVITCNIWITTIFLSGMKQYKAIVWLYLFGYVCTIAAALLWRRFKLEGLMSGFGIGQAVLLMGMTTLILRRFPTERLISFEFFSKPICYPSLLWIGRFYNLGVWIDKFMFWFSSDTARWR